MEKSLENMSLIELIKAYNELVSGDDGQLLNYPKNRTISKFDNEESAIKKYNSILSSIRAIKKGIRQLNRVERKPARRKVKKVEFTSSGQKKVIYTKREEILLKILRRKKVKINSLDLVDEFYKEMGIERPFHARPIVIATMRQLIEKSIFNEETWKIKKTEKTGAKPVQYWIEG